jgi:hypothetical protein
LLLLRLLLLTFASSLLEPLTTVTQVLRGQPQQPRGLGGLSGRQLGHTITS